MTFLITDKESVFERQNTREMLLLLKAQSSYYTSAKKVFYSGLIISLFGTVFFAVATTLYTSGLLNTLSAFFAVLIFAIGSYTQRKSVSYTELAARIQQTFDVMLFSLSNDSSVLKKSEIQEICAPYVQDDLHEFKNWYSDYSGTKFTTQVFYSQKENIRWDRNLRKKYLRLNNLFGVFVGICVAIYAVFFNATASHFFAIVAWLFPLGKHFAEQHFRLSDNILSLDNINLEFKAVEKEFDSYSENEQYCKLCGLQSSIFEHRKKSVNIPNWFYRLNKNKMQQYEDDLAKEIVGQ